MKLIVSIPQDQSDDIGGLPAEVKSLPLEKLAVLSECLEIVALELSSRSFRNDVGQIFAAGDVSIISTDYFSPMIEKLLLLEARNPKGISKWQTV